MDFLQNIIDNVLHKIKITRYAKKVGNVTHNNEKIKMAKRNGFWKGQGFQNSCYKYIRELKERR